MKVHVLDYGAGNVRSVHNAIHSVAPEADIVYVESAETLVGGEIKFLVFPGVGHFSQVVEFMDRNDGVYRKALIEMLKNEDIKFFGICVGLQALFDGSEEYPQGSGLGVVPGTLKHFSTIFEPEDSSLSVPHIGWNTVHLTQSSNLISEANRYYFVHSFSAQKEVENEPWVLATTKYGNTEFIAAVQNKNILATQFHPEKSGFLGLKLLSEFLEKPLPIPKTVTMNTPGLSKRLVVCLDVRRDDAGQLVVTKGVGYDVREKSGANEVRNLGSAVEMAEEYYKQGCDELSFLSIMSFKGGALEDMPIQNLLKDVSKKVFVPLAIGGGIRSYESEAGVKVSALQVAERFFRCGADKVCIGSDAVSAVQAWLTRGKVCDGSSSIESISKPYGAQAVVISVDSKRQYTDLDVNTDYSKSHILVTHLETGKPCWCNYICTVAGGRKDTDLSVFDLVEGVTALGAGEIMLNCIDFDGKNKGFDLEFIREVKRRSKLPLIASSGAGNPAHFVDLFKSTPVEAGLAAGMFHRGEFTVEQVKQTLISNDVVTNYL